LDETRAPDSQAEAHARLLAWLTLAFRDPQEVPIGELANSELKSWAATAGIELGSLPAPKAVESSALTEELAPEYVRLFVNSMGAELAHLEAAAYRAESGPEGQSEFLAELGETLQRAGYAPEESGNRSEDHLSLLLEFLYRDEEQRMLRPAEREFARHFLLPWLPTMLERLAAAAPHPFYERAGRTLAACFDLQFPSAPGEP